MEFTIFNKNEMMRALLLIMSMFTFLSCNTKMVQQEKTIIPSDYTEVKVIDATQGACDFLLQIAN